MVHPRTTGEELFTKPDSVYFTSPMCRKQEGRTLFNSLLQYFYYWTDSNSNNAVQHFTIYKTFWVNTYSFKPLKLHTQIQIKYKNRFVNYNLQCTHSVLMYFISEYVADVFVSNCSKWEDFQTEHCLVTTPQFPWTKRKPTSDLSKVTRLVFNRASLLLPCLPPKIHLCNLMRIETALAVILHHQLQQPCCIVQHY